MNPFATMAKGPPTEEHFQESGSSWKIRHVCDYNIASK